MKKYSVLFAALAVIALAGCKKEEIRGGIVIGGETYQNVDKQAYSPDYLAVFFDGTDNILWNGVVYPYTMIDNPTSRNTVTTYSHYALLNVPTDAIVDDVTILYPGETSISIPATGTIMVNQANNAGLPNHIDNCIWPMGYHSSNFHSHGQIILKNAVALISPAVKYGVTCFQGIVDANSAVFGPMNLTSADFAVAEDLPAMVVTSVELSSTDRRLTGPAHIQFDDADIPCMVMDGTIGESADVLAVAAPGVGVTIPAAADQYKNVGFIPVTPALVGGNISMKVFFDFYLEDGTILHCVYNGESKAVAENHIIRGYITDFRINMNTPQNASKVQILSVE